MASSSISKASSHARSISLPSRPHPIADQFEENLSRLSSSNSASTSSSSLSHSLSGLKDLYHSVDKFLHLPLNQQALSQNVHPKLAEDVLDGSLRLLDICGISWDVLQQTKESLQEIQSVFRRKYSGELSINKEVVEYMKMRMTTKKIIKKCLKGLKEADKKDESNVVFLSMLKEVEAVTVDIFKSLLSYVSGDKSESKKSGWFIVSKLISDKKSEAMIGEFAAVDSTLNSLISQKKKSGINVLQVEDIQSEIIKLETEIQDLDEVLECLSRHLVKTRATLLNILTN